MTTSEAYRLISSAQSYLLFGNRTSWNSEAYRILARIDQELIRDSSVSVDDVAAGYNSTDRWVYIGKLLAEVK